jgi:hypothetical protein
MSTTASRSSQTDERERERCSRAARPRWGTRGGALDGGKEERRRVADSGGQRRSEQVQATCKGEATPWARAIRLGRFGGSQFCRWKWRARRRQKKRKTRWWTAWWLKYNVTASGRPAPTCDASMEAAACPTWCGRCWRAATVGGQLRDSRLPTYCSPSETPTSHLSFSWFLYSRCCDLLSKDVHPSQISTFA